MEKLKFSNLNSFSPLSCYREDKYSDLDDPYHKHSCFEIMYSNGGEFILYVKDENGETSSYPVKTNEYVFVNSMVTHCIRIPDKCNISNIEIAVVPRAPETMHIDYFSLLQNNPSFGDLLLSAADFHIETDRANISSILNSLIKVFSIRESPVDDMVCQSLLYRLLLELHKSETYFSSQNTGVIYTRDAVRFINENILLDISAADVINHIGISASYLQRLFKKKFGFGIRGYINKNKIDFAKSTFMTTASTIDEVRKKCGYKNLASFVYEFKTFTGQTPTSFRVGLNNEKIQKTLDNYTVEIVK